MLDTATDGRAVHFPKDPDLFSFDGEVSAIFPDMAKRAIPNFYASHATHAHMLKPWVRPGLSIMDVGASRGAFFQALQHAYPQEWADGQFKLFAIDNSEDMCMHLRRDFPSITTSMIDITTIGFRELPIQYDVVCCHYVLQFLPERFQQPVLEKLLDMVKPGGVFIYGHKARHYGTLGQIAHEEYIQFRLRNGYTPEEIAAKTQALKGSMFPLDHTRLMETLQRECSEVQETYRFMMFSTLFARK